MPLCDSGPTMNELNFGAGIALATGLIAAGIIVLADLHESHTAWGAALIVCGVAFFTGMLLHRHRAKPPAS